MGSNMSEHEREAEAKAVAELERKIVKVTYTEKTSVAGHTEAKKIDTAKILILAKKIRESYDYNDVALDGAR